VRSTVILAVTFTIYLILIALFTYTEPQSKTRFTKGFECTQEAKLVYEAKCPFLGSDEISSANYDEERMWTPTSVSLMKWLIFIVWVAFFAALSVVLGSFVIFQSGQKQKVNAAGGKPRRAGRRSHRRH
jgi:hypothetical protein